MKGVNLFCASQASTAICVSLDQRSMVRESSRAIERYNPHLRDVRRGRRKLTPCYSQSSSSTWTNKAKDYNQERRRHSSAHPSDLTSPSASSRYLLSNTPFFDVISDFDKVSALAPIEPASKPRQIVASKTDQSSVLFKASFPARPEKQQVVVLKVSLHCKGCEGKVRKHISKMEGVTSFTIDFATKKVTIIGNVTPLGVLASVSRVKNAQFWPPTSIASSQMPVMQTYKVTRGQK
ncbi:hypothetical protein Scep_004498 [Stephania cephalantha]|uniref:HMA domain-containing protein n=1 Tax=Stephania cephalantha TaxID=152367 RepID=A0AAP0KU76_9MAGN